MIEMLQQVLATITSVGDLANFNAVNILSMDGLVRELKTPKKRSTKFYLKFVMTRAQKSVVNRELTKSSFTNILHEFRMAYWHLGAMLVKEGLLPEKELIFFMTPAEWRKLIENRDPFISRRALQRKIIYPQLDKDTFPEFVYGVPKPNKPPKRGDHIYDDKGVRK